MQRLAIGLLGLVVVGGLLFYFVSRPMMGTEIPAPQAATSEPNSPITSTLAPDTALAEKQCSDTITEDCVMQGTLHGYYYSYIQTDDGAPPNAERCDAFVVQGGDPDGIRLKNYFLGSVNAGNTVNRKTSGGDLILNISTKSLHIMEQLKSSSMSNPVDLVVKKRIAEGKEAPLCYSLVDIIGIGM